MIARMWKLSKVAILPTIDATQHGWDKNMLPKWSTDIFPDDVSQIIVQHDFEDYTLDNDEESDTAMDE